jgi:RNA polymerase sigma-70 factor (ECF subfamily)
VTEDKEIAFKRLYYKIQPSLVGFAVSYVKEKQIAEELVNNVFLKIWEKWNKIEHQSIKKYLFQAVKNTCYNYLRDQKKHLQTDDLEATKDVVFQPIDNFAFLETSQKVTLLINHLPPKCKQVFLLSRMGEMQNKQIAKLLDISEKTVENQMTKALKFLRENLKNL